MDQERFFTHGEILALYGAGTCGLVAVSNASEALGGDTFDAWAAGGLGAAALALAAGCAIHKLHRMRNSGNDTVNRREN